MDHGAPRPIPQPAQFEVQQAVLLGPRAGRDVTDVAPGTAADALGLLGGDGVLVAVAAAQFAHQVAGHSQEPGQCWLRNVPHAPPGDGERLARDVLAYLSTHQTRGIGEDARIALLVDIPEALGMCHTPSPHIGSVTKQCV
jgi:hypothetical protein